MRRTEKKPEEQMRETDGAQDSQTEVSQNPPVRNRRARSSPKTFPVVPPEDTRDSREGPEDSHGVPDSRKGPENSHGVPDSRERPENLRSVSGENTNGESQNAPEETRTVSGDGEAAETGELRAEAESDEDETPGLKEQNSGKKSWIRAILTRGIGPYTLAVWLLIGILLLVFLYSSVRLLNRFGQDRENRAIQERNAAIMAQSDERTTDTPAPTQTPVPAITLEPGPTWMPQKQNISATSAPTATLAPRPTAAVIQSRFDPLLAMNSDTIGWLKVDALYRIDFVVVQGKNSFYVSHDFNKQENVNGTAFLDEQCRPDKKPDNYMVFAHNMKTGDMFGELNQLSDRKKVQANPLTHFDTLYENGDYIPFAAGRVSLIPGDRNYFPFFESHFRTEKQFQAFVSSARAISDLSVSVDVVYGDQLLSLITCTGNDDERYIVVMRKVRPGEDVRLTLKGN